VSVLQNYAQRTGLAAALVFNFLWPERQTNSEPKAEDNYKSRTMNFQPGTADK
jgi:hypothetical protein